MALSREQLYDKFGEHAVLMFKGEEPFVEYGANTGIPMGMLIGRETGEICCYKCGGWFRSLGQHVNAKHGLSAKEYKIEYGLSNTVGLVSKETSRRMSQAVLNQIEKGNVHNPSTLTKGKKVGTTRGSKSSLQMKNKRNTCPEQYKQRLRMVCDMFNGDPTIKQIQQTDPGLHRWMYETYGSVRRAKEAVGYTSSRINTRVDYIKLIYRIREYVKEKGKMPWKNNISIEPGFPNRSTFLRHFGSMNRGYEICGVKAISARKNIWRLVSE